MNEDRDNYCRVSRSPAWGEKGDMHENKIEGRVGEGDEFVEKAVPALALLGGAVSAAKLKGLGAAGMKILGQVLAFEGGLAVVQALARRGNLTLNRLRAERRALAIRRELGLTKQRRRGNPRARIVSKAASMGARSGGRRVGIAVARRSGTIALPRK